MSPKTAPPIKAGSGAAVTCERFGGSHVLADLLKINRSTTWRWERTGYIPPKYHAKILKLADRKRISLSPLELVMGIDGSPVGVSR